MNTAKTKTWLLISKIRKLHYGAWGSILRVRTEAKNWNSQNILSTDYSNSKKMCTAMCSFSLFKHSKVLTRQTGLARNAGTLTFFDKARAKKHRQQGVLRCAGKLSHRHNLRYIPVEGVVFVRTNSSVETCHLYSPQKFCLPFTSA